MKKKTITLILIAALLFTFGCSRKGNYSLSRTERLAYDDLAAFESGSGIAFYPEGPAGVEGQISPAFRDMSNLYGAIEQSADTSSPTAANSSNADRKLVKTAYTRIRVENLDAANDSISELMKKYNAYAAMTEIGEDAHSYSLRVPSAAYDAFLNEMDGMGRVIRRTESTEDVTVRYYDLEGRLATKMELLKTYQSYLGRAKNIEEILSVEARIADLQNEIDRTGTQFRGLANQVDYATISLNILGPATSTHYQTTTFGERVRVLFGGFGGFLSTVVVIIMGIVIYGIPILLLAALFYWVLFGRIGLMKKLWRTVTSKKQG